MPRYEYPGYGPSGDGWLTKRPGTKGGYHGGTDNPAKPNTPVYAEYSGKIFRSGVIAGYGRAVVVDSVAPGQPIPGAVIGTKDYVQSMGGLSTGPHLHREIISGNVRLNPRGPFGIYSSEVDHKVDPDTFDIGRPFFPYEQQGQRSSLQSKSANDVSKQAPGTDRIIISPPVAPFDSRLMPGMPIPGAEGSTSIGGPGGPQPVVPPASPPASPRNPLRGGGVLSPLNLGFQSPLDAGLPPDQADGPQDRPPAVSYLAMPASLPETEGGKGTMGMPRGLSRPGDLPVASSASMLGQAYPVRRLISRVARQ